MYAGLLLEQLPRFFRSSVLLALTDLKHITFVRVTRDSHSQETTYEVSDEMDNVLEALCIVLGMSDVEVKAVVIIARMRLIACGLGVWCCRMHGHYIVVFTHFSGERMP